MSSLIKEVTKEGAVKEVGIFDPLARYAFTNITNEDFVSGWNGETFTIKPGQTVELPQHLANKFVDELVDKIIINKTKADELAVNQPLYRSPTATDIGIPAKRKIIEDQIIKKLEIDPDEPQFKILRSEVKSQIEADIAKSSEITADISTVTVDQGEFADLGKKS